MDKLVAIVCIFFAGLWAGVELTTALRPHRVEYLTVKDPPRPPPQASWWTNDCNEVSRICRARERLTKVKARGT